MHIGDCEGFDKLAIRYCTEHNISYTIFFADKEAYGRHAGLIRTRNMILGASCLLAFPTTDSSGTYSAINISIGLGIPRADEPTRIPVLA